MGSLTERLDSELVQATVPASQPSIFQANPLLNVQASSQKRVAQQGNSPMVAFRPFMFQGESQTYSFSPPTQQFTFDVSPTNPTRFVSLAFTLLNTSTQSTPNLRPNQLPNARVSSQEHPAQGNSPATTFQPFTFQAGPTPHLPSRSGISNAGSFFGLLPCAHPYSLKIHRYRFGERAGQTPSPRT
jgi:hypothetical protein